MKYFILILAITSVLIWPLNYLSANHNVSLIPHTIFEPDYQARQQILRNINLYPTVLMARLFQNKAVIVTNKYLDNLFTLIDSNYYFFGSHPREVVNGQNYTRLPLLTVIPILFFVFKSHNRRKKIYLTLLAIELIVLSFFSNNFVYDFVLWPIFILMIYFGVLELWHKNKCLGTIFCSMLLIEVVYEFSRIVQ